MTSSEREETRILPWQVPLLERALQLKSRQRLPHAVLIDDAGHLDSRDFVRYLATLLLCEQPREVTPCGECEPCRMMRAQTYSDFRLVTLEPDEKSKKPTKNIKIDQIRELIHELYLTHHYDRLKIATVYPAEAMSPASANALLKTLEEPADGVLILLVTHKRGRIPITLRSRCQLWRISLPSLTDASEWLQQRQMSAEEAASYLEFSSGDPALALELKRNDYASLVTDFKRRLANYLSGKLAISSLCQGLMTYEVSLLRRLIDMTLNAYCYRASGLDKYANPTENADRRQSQLLLELRSRAQKLLLVEENNLDLRLQLEDVLISLKQIITRRTI